MRQSKKCCTPVKVGARGSPLSRAQVEEVMKGVEYEPIWVQTTGDLDQKTSLRTLDKTDFFTRELDQMLLKKEIRIAIHSAKDLPEPLPKGLVAILTKCLDDRDVLVGEPKLVATSSVRREEAVRALFPEARFIDLRGTIQERLRKIETGEVDGVVVAECALIRLKLTHLKRVYLNSGAPNQGRLAVVCREDDAEMIDLIRTEV